ncbi:MAG: S-layer homology domain-containing protein, partial [Rubrobacteridae bacterium]|nr:S-layer homology domain-containing protein [Rubrobacteridae bacterium]
GTGGDIYYTTDGSDPTASSTKTKYTAAFDLTQTATVKAAVNSDTAWSEIASADFTKEAIPVISVTINEKPVSLQVGDAKQLTTTVAPEDASDKSVSWSVETETAPGVVIMSDGLVTAKKAGTAVIRATNPSSGVFDECTVTVTNPTVIKNLIVNPLSHTEGTTQTIQINTTLYDHEIFGDMTQRVSAIFKDDGGNILSKTAINSGFNPSIEQTVTISDTATVGNYLVQIEVLLYGESDYDFSDARTVQYVINKKTQPGGGNGGGGSSSGGSSSSGAITPIVEVKAETITPPVTDINNHWAHDCITALLKHGEISGYPDHTIKPDKEMTRAEAANLLVSALGLKNYQLKNKANSYKDKLPSWCENAILIATEKGLMKGYPDGTFRPDNSITRAEMCVTLMKAFPNQTNTISTLTFKDKSEIPNWAKDSIEQALAGKTISGYPDNTFRSQDHITRAEVFSMICKLKGYHSEHSNT